MNKTLIALLAAASVFAFGSAQAADAAAKPADKPMADAAKPAEAAKPSKKAMKHRLSAKKAEAKKAEEAKPTDAAKK
jgi:hypothetical protein